MANWLLSKTISPSLEMGHAQGVCSGGLSDHIASGTGGRVETSQMKSLHVSHLGEIYEERFLCSNSDLFNAFWKGFSEPW